MLEFSASDMYMFGWVRDRLWSSERGEISEESRKVICRDTGKNRGARCGCLGIHALDCELGKGINQAAVSHVDVEIEMREKIGTENGLLNICNDEYPP